MIIYDLSFSDKVLRVSKVIKIASEEAEGATQPRTTRAAMRLRNDAEKRTPPGIPKVNNKINQGEKTQGS